MKGVLSAAALMASALGSGQGKALSAREVYAKAKGSVVRIRCVSHEKGETIISSGSGFFFGGAGVIATSYHVIDSAESITVTDAAGKTLPVASVMFDADADVALLVLRNASSRKPLASRAFAKVEVGENVFTIGDPLGILPSSLSQGIVSAKRKIKDVSIIQMTAPISHGSSGGPVLDERGQVIGLVRSVFEDGQNLNLAVSIDEVKRMVYGRTRYTIASFLKVNAEFNAEAEEVAAPKSEPSRKPVQEEPPKPIGRQAMREAATAYVADAMNRVIAADQELMALTIENARNLEHPLDRIESLVRDVETALSRERFVAAIFPHQEELGADPDSVNALWVAIHDAADAVADRFDSFRRLAPSSRNYDKLKTTLALAGEARTSDRHRQAIFMIRDAAAKCKWLDYTGILENIAPQNYVWLVFFRYPVFLDMSSSLVVRVRYAIPESQMRTGDVIVAIAPEGSSDFTDIRTMKDLDAFLAFGKGGGNIHRGFAVRAMRDGQTVTLKIEGWPDEDKASPWLETPDFHRPRPRGGIG